MIRFLGKNNDLRTEEGKITKTGYAVMILSSVFGLGLFLTGRYIASITNLMGWHIADILLPARIKQLKEKILIIR